MWRVIGQAAGWGGSGLHRLVRLVLALVVLAVLGAVGLAWRLSTGPLEMDFLARRIEAAANDADAPGRIAIGGAALVWEGFTGGVDRPLDIRLTNVAAYDGAGQLLASLPAVDVSVSVAGLLRGRVMLRAIDVRNPSLRLVRGADGAVALDFAPTADAPPADTPPIESVPAKPSTPLLTRVLTELARPQPTDWNAESDWGQLRRVRIRDARITLVDRQLDFVWRTPRADLDLRRRPEGGLTGDIRVDFAMGGSPTSLTVRADLPPGSDALDFTAELPGVVPAAIAAAIPRLAPLAALDAPLSLSASGRITADPAKSQLRLHALLAAGRATYHGTTIQLRGGEMGLEGTLTEQALTALRLDVAAKPDGPVTRITASGTLRERDGRRAAELSLGVDRLALADLPALWPQGVGGHGAHDWLVTNLTAGTVRNAHAEVKLSAAADGGDLAVTALTGGLEGHDITAHWLRPIPPIEQANGMVTVTGPDSMEIRIDGGHQANSRLVLKGGKLVFTGLAAPDQFLDIAGDLEGPVPDLLAVLRHPRLHLFDHHPLDLQDPRGQMAGRLTITRLPLKDEVPVEALVLRAVAKVTGLHLGALVAGRDLDNGQIDLDATTQGMKLSGTAELGGIASQAQAEFDFRPGNATQITQKIAVTATADAAQLRAVGLDAGPVLTGPADLRVNLQTRRDNRTEIAVRADLARAGLQLPWLNWRKPPAVPAVAEARVQLEGDRLTGIDNIRVTGDGLAVQGALGFAAGRPQTLRLQQFVLGRDTNLRGDLALPQRATDPYVANLTGASLDASAQFGKREGRRDARSGDKDGPRQSGPPQSGPPPSGPPWNVDARLDRVVLGPNRLLTAVTAHGESDGRIIRQGRLAGNSDGGRPFSLAITPRPGGRTLDGKAEDAGGLLRALGVIDDMYDGHLTLSGSYDDRDAAHPLTGHAEISNFRMRNAPALARVLQGMTLYGLVNLVEGTGLGFDQLIAPFRLAEDRLTLNDARAFNAALGMTAQGDIDLAADRCALNGTIVPAYFFNSLLGNIPVLGRIFSPERGGGLFAATYTINGPCGDPTVAVNPLAALTPGFLRGVFGIFDGPSGNPLQPGARGQEPTGGRN